MNEAIHQFNGACLCGVVTFSVLGKIPAPDACHCTKCRKFSGHYFVSTDIPKQNVKIVGEQNIRWFQSSEKVRRGFCSVCGSSLFFDPLFHDWIGVALGAFDTPTETHIEKHIFVSNKGDYYEIKDGLPQNMQ